MVKQMQYKLTDELNKVNDSSDGLQEIVSEMLNTYCSQLDEYMGAVDDVLRKKGQPSTSELEEMILNLNSILYWAGTGLELTTIRESVAKMAVDEKFNKVYNDTSGTIGDKKATAQLESQKETLAKLCYTNAVKLYQHKIDRASEMVSAMKKILTHRISETQMSGMVIK